MKKNAAGTEKLAVTNEMLKSTGGDIENEMAGFVRTDGTRSMTAPLDLGSWGFTSTDEDSGASKKYVTTSLSNAINGKFLHLTGGTITGTLNVKARGSSVAEALRGDSYATNTLGGTVKMRVASGILYITNDGSNA